MKRFITWTFYLSKRQLMNIFFIIILLIMPIASILLINVATSYEASISIGILDENNTSLSKKLVSNLTSANSIISYNIYTNEEQLISDVTSGKIQCGYIIVENFDTRIESGSTAKLLKLVSTPDNSIALLSNELLFSKVFEEMGYYSLMEEIKDANIFEDLNNEDYLAIRNDYDTFTSSGKTFNFNYTSNSGTYVTSNNINVLSYITTPIRGLVALCIFMGALAGGFTYLKDKRHGFKSVMCVYDILVPVVLTSISGVVSLMITNITKSLVTETLTIVLYDIVVILFVFLLSHMIRSFAVYCSTIPIFAIGSLVCSPIFINLATFFPVVKVIRIFFMPTHYYNILNYLNDILI